MPNHIVKAFRIRNWQKHFENHESRKLRSLTWLPVPNKHDGRGYRRVTALPNSVQVFCGWALMLQVASKMPTRGVLADDDGALTASDLSDKTGFPKIVFEAALSALAREDIRWLEEVDWPISGEPPDVSRNLPLQGKGREGHGMEEKRGSAPARITEEHAPPKLEPNRSNRPNSVELAAAQAEFTRINEREKAQDAQFEPYTADEVRQAWHHFEGYKDPETSEWLQPFGNTRRPIGDWRSAMMERIGHMRNSYAKRNTNSPGTALEKFGAGSRRNAGCAVASGSDIARAAARRTAKPSAGQT